MKKHTPNIAFLHIPKAGGTTLRNILQRQYPPSAVYEIGPDINGDINKFRMAPAEMISQKKLLIGHMSHGLHSLFPTATICLTMLRNPVDRVYSEYRFLSSNRYHPLYALVSGLTYHQYLDLDPTRQAGNGQTRLLSGSTYGDQIGVPGTEPLNWGHLSMASYHLKRHYPLVGLLEYFDESLMLWGEAFGWRYLFYEKKNITKKKPLALSKSEIEHTLEKNRMDMVLYRQAVECFKDNLKKQSMVFSRKLSAFRLLNRTYQKIKHHGRTLKHLILAIR